MSSGAIIFSVKSWEGQYASWDVPGGVESSPHANAICVVGVDGGGLTALDGLVANAQAPRFSPDGRWLYVQSDAAGHWDIYRGPAAGGETVNLTADHRLGRDSFGFEASRDGRRVLFVSNDGAVGRVAIMDADGSGPRIIAPDIGYHYMASFSPDGRRIVFSHTADGYRLKTMDLDGGNMTVLTPDHPESFV